MKLGIQSSTFGIWHGLVNKLQGGDLESWGLVNLKQENVCIEVGGWWKWYIHHMNVICVYTYIYIYTYQIYIICKYIRLLYKGVFIFIYFFIWSISTIWAVSPSSKPCQRTRWAWNDIWETVQERWSRWPACDTFTFTVENEAPNSVDIPSGKLT